MIINQIVKKDRSLVTVPFSATPIPKSNWAVDSVNSSYYASENSLGKWRATVGYNQSYIPAAFDGDTSTRWYGYSASNYTFDIECPVLINPTSIYIDYMNVTGGKVYGYNPETSNWIQLNDGNLVASESVGGGTTTLSLSGNVFYSKFRLTLPRYSSNQSTVYLYEFQIKSGFMKV